MLTMGQPQRPTQLHAPPTPATSILLANADLPPFLGSKFTLGRSLCLVSSISQLFCSPCIWYSARFLLMLSALSMCPLVAGGQRPLCTRGINEQTNDAQVSALGQAYSPSPCSSAGRAPVRLSCSGAPWKGWLHTTAHLLPLQLLLAAGQRRREWGQPEDTGTCTDHVLVLNKFLI